MTTAIDLKHPFEESLGLKGPYRVVSYLNSRQLDRVAASMTPNSYNDWVKFQVKDTLGSNLGGTCDHCGRGIVHCYKIKAHNGVCFWVGSSCVASTGQDAAMLLEAKQLRKTSDRSLEKVEKECAHEQFIKVRKAELSLEWADNFEHPTVKSIIDRFNRTGYLTDKQINLLYSIYRDAWTPERLTLEDAIAPNDVRREITGKILSAQWRENDFGSSYKLLIGIIEDGKLWKTWGTCPSQLVPDYGYSIKGHMITLTGTFTRSDDDKAFAFFKRPSKARLHQPAVKVSVLDY